MLVCVYICVHENLNILGICSCLYIHMYVYVSAHAVGGDRISQQRSLRTVGASGSGSSKKQKNAEKTIVPW